MRNLNRILVPTDFSEGSQAAYEYAKKVTGVCGGVVNLMHIVPTLQYFSNSMNVVGYPPSLDQPKPGLEEEVLARLEEALLENFGKDHMGEAIVKLGRKTYMEIAREAEKKEYDLVIMGKTGSHGAFILGNVTEKVVRHSPKPVLSVNKKPQPDGLKRFMVPTDYSQYSLQSLHEAILLGSLTNGEIILFHVLELFGSPSENEPMIPDQDVENSVRMKLLNRVDTYLQARGEWNMQLVRDINGRTGHFLIRGEEEEEEAVPFSVEIQRGVGAHHAITDFAAEHADLIIINTHGRGGFSRMFIGSTTERVIQQSGKPVLSIKAEEEQQIVE